VSRPAACAALRASDFERLLSTRPCARSEHFVLHHVPASWQTRSAELSTPAAPGALTHVDDRAGVAPLAIPAEVHDALAVDAAVARLGGNGDHCVAWAAACRFALVVPKRHARRAVTRSLIKRQGRAQFAAHAARLAAGDWLLRLRAGFPLPQFPSAASTALRVAVRAELQTLFRRVAAPAP
jgi:ribonuclease P protein component